MNAVPDLLQFAKNFREWYALHFEDFDSQVNAQLLCLDNDAAQAIIKAEGQA